jgi:predicted Zn-dependent peptidase
LAGISHFVEHMVFKGTERRPDPIMISEAIEGVGGHLNATTDHEHTAYSALVPSNHLSIALDVLTDMLLFAQFTLDEVERERQVILEELRSTDDSPSELNDLLFDKMLWPGHTLGLDVAGTIRSASTISASDLQAHTANFYTPDNLVVSIAGNVEHDEVVRQVEALWAAAVPGNGAPRWDSPEQLLSVERVRLHKKRTAQTNLILGAHALPYTDERRAVQDVLDGVLGAGMSSRLFVELRENRGLAYSISSFVRTYADVGAFGIHAAIEGSNLVPTLEVLLRELDRIASEPVGEAELRKVKEYIKGHTLLSLERSGNVAHWAGWQELMLGRIESVDEVLQRVERVAPGDVLRLAADLFSRERLLLALVGPASDVPTLVDMLAGERTTVVVS